MYNFKHKKTGKVISSDCFDKVPFHDKMQYVETHEPVTDDCVDDSDDSNIIAKATVDAIEEITSVDTGGVDTPDFGGFGDGDTGGGGAGGDY